MTQNRNDRRAGPQSSARPRRPQTQNGSHRAYDWTQDRRASAPQRAPGRRAIRNRRWTSPAGMGASSTTGTTASSSLSRRPAAPTARAGQDRPPSGPAAGPEASPPEHTAISPQRPAAGSAQNNGRYRPTEANLRSPARREGKKKRRLTRAAIRRRRAIRRLTALALLLCVIGVGVYLTVTMLFKINTLQVVSDGAVVSEVGGYSSAEILEALGVHVEENIFSFDPAEKSAALEPAVPSAGEHPCGAGLSQYGGGAADAATAAYAMQTSGGWLSLSAGLKILDKTAAQPELPVLYGGEPESATPGVQLEFAADTPAASDSAASSEAAAPADKRLDSLNTLLTALDSSGLGADVTRIEFEDPEQMAFLYQGRISVLLGT